MKTAARLLSLVFLSAAAAATDAPEIPSVGDWMEYRLAFPADPLEGSVGSGILPSNPSGPAGLGTPDGGADSPPPPPAVAGFSPNFDPEQRWNVMPVRIEVRQVLPSGLEVMLTIPGIAREAVIPLDGGPLPGLAGAGAGVARERFGQTHVAGRREYEVVMERFDDPDEGFVRLTSPELPFGLARFATPHCDLILVDMGAFPAPDFPVRSIAIDPPPGQLRDNF